MARSPVCPSIIVLSVSPPGLLVLRAALLLCQLLKRLGLFRDACCQRRKLRVAIKSQAAQAEHKVSQLLAAPHRPRFGCGIGWFGGS